MVNINIFAHNWWHLEGSNLSDAYKLIFYDVLKKHGIKCNKISLFSRINYNPNDVNVFLTSLPPTFKGIFKGYNNYVVPIYDDLGWFTNKVKRDVVNYNVKVISLSKGISDICKLEGIKYKEFKYFPDMTSYKTVDYGNERNLFYWNRCDMYTPDMLNNICQAFNVDNFYMLNRIDTRKPTIYNVSDFDIGGKVLFKVIDKMNDGREEFLKLTNDCNMFLCGREKEGIGVTNVEQLCRGSFLIGRNDHTMCDYIKHKHNGYLFNKLEDLNKNIDVDFDVEKCIENNINEFSTAYIKYEKDIVNYFKKIIKDADK